MDKKPKQFLLFTIKIFDIFGGISKGLKNFVESNKNNIGKH